MQASVVHLIPDQMLRFTYVIWSIFFSFVLLNVEAIHTLAIVSLNGREIYEVLVDAVNFQYRELLKVK